MKHKNLGHFIFIPTLPCSTRASTNPKSKPRILHASPFARGNHSTFANVLFYTDANTDENFVIAFNHFSYIRYRNHKFPIVSSFHQSDRLFVSVLSCELLS